MHLEPGVANGHFNVLRGALKEPIDSAGVKVVGEFVDNDTLGLPSELAILLLFDPRTGVPKAILDASGMTGKLSATTLHAELGQIVAGLKPGRKSEDETNLLWHRGLSLSDIALGHAMLAKADRLGIGQRLRFA